MGGFLSGLLTAVAIVATVASGGTLGILAGAMIAMSYAASKGWIGGSVGGFFNSSTGHYLTMAVGLASAATSIMSDTAAVTSTSASATTASANAAAEGATQAGVDAVGTQANTALAADQADTAMAASGSGAINGATQASNLAAPTVTGTAAQTMAPGSLSQTAASLDGDGTLSGSNGLSQQALAQNDLTSQSISKNLGIPSNAGPQVSGAPASTDVSTGQTNLAENTATANTNAQAATAGPGTDVTSASAGKDLTPGQMAQSSPNFNGGASPGPSIGSQATGMLGKAADYVGKNPGVAVMGGQALSGMAQGAAQQKMMQEQIAANQWGNMQWQDPTQVAKLNAQAAQPIGVPVGYLNRAAAVRNLMNGSTTQTAPLQSNGGAVTPQTPQAMAPVGMGAGPVQPVGTPAPRGGM